MKKAFIAALVMAASASLHAGPFSIDENENILLKGREATYAEGVSNTFSIRGGHITQSNIADFGGLRITGISNGIANTDLATVGQLNNSVSLLEYRLAVLEGAITESDATGYFTPKSASSSEGSMMAMLASAKTFSVPSGAPMMYADAVTTDYVDDRFDQLVEETSAYTDRSVKALTDKLSAGVAASVARPMMPGLAPGEKAVAVGTGHYNGKNALGFAAGFSPQENLIWTAGVSLSDTHGQSLFSVGFNRRF